MDKKTIRTPQEKQVYDKSYYRGRHSNYIFWYHNLKYHIFWARRLGILKKAATSGKILDVGCAFGFFIKLLEKEFKVYGIDISSYAIEKAANVVSHPERVKCCDIHHGIPFNETFDAITAFDIMEHIRDPVNVFSILHKALKKGGSLYLEFPIAKTLVNFDRGHYYRPLEKWINYLRQAGFKLWSTKYYYTVGLRAVMIPAIRNVNYCSIVVKK